MDAEQDKKSAGALAVA